jgi:hypothetical protein
MYLRAFGLRGLLALVSLPLAFSGFTTASDPEGGSQTQTSTITQEAPSRLAVLWTSGDREVALKVAFMYTHNAKLRGWFDEVTLIVWGPSSRLLAEDEELQESVRQMAEAGVEIVACRACADSYGVSETLERMGIDVKYMGVPLTEMLKGDWEVITF